MKIDKLRSQVIDLGPWHMQVQITPEVSTEAWLDHARGLPVDNSPDAKPPTFIRTRDSWLEKMTNLFPDGFAGRSLLDCACNCGGYGFFAKELGAGRVYGFDVREHWIRQARFIQAHRTVGPTDEMQYETHDLYELDASEHDVTLFGGIFYHLPDPVHGLRIAADRTRELLIVNTTVTTGDRDGYLRVKHESRTNLMSGVHDLSWFPTGPRVLQEILGSLGFPETRLAFWRRNNGPGGGRLELLAARDASTFAAYDEKKQEEKQERERGAALAGAVR